MMIRVMMIRVHFIVRLGALEVIELMAKSQLRSRPIARTCKTINFFFFSYNIKFTR